MDYRINADDEFEHESEYETQSEQDENPVSLNMQYSKAELIEEVEREVKDRKCFATITSIVRYLNADHQRNQRAIKIGVCTVFILATVITMFKSIIDCSPILFVKVGQDQVGAIDFVTTSSNSSMITANMNYYAINPFDNPLAIGTETT